MLNKLSKLIGVRATAAAIVTKNSKVLLTKRSRKMPLEGGKWCLPGGHIEVGEKAEDSIKREVEEETGFKAEKAEFLFYQDEISKTLKRHNIVLVFKVEVSGKRDTNWEVSQMKWFPKKEIQGVNLAFRHKQILERYFEEFGR
ncbi:MAG: NUDIX hydrolase [Candidatus Pacearchaeota archaeon]